MTESPTDRLTAGLPEPLAAAVRAGTATAATHDVPGLPAGTVWRVALDDLDHPQQTYAGLPPDGPAVLLPDDQPAFAALVAGWGGAAIDDADTALGYVLGFLEVTRGPAVIVRPLGSVDDIRWRPGSDDEEARRAAFTADQSVRSPTAEPLGDGYRVEVWLVVDQRIQVNTFVVDADGHLDSSYRVVAQDLPLPIAR